MFLVPLCSFKNIERRYVLQRFGMIGLLRILFYHQSKAVSVVINKIINYLQKTNQKHLNITLVEYCF